MSEPDPKAADRARRSFGPVVLAGLAGGGAAAIGGHKEMLSVPTETLTAAGGLALGLPERSVEFALAGALALVVLACWGVLLVTRGVVRRVVAAIGALAAIGIVAVVVVGGFVQDDDAAADLAVRLGLNAAAIRVERTVWLWVTLAGGLIAAISAVFAVRQVRFWPEMGTRYDAPGTPVERTGERPAGEAEEQSNIDLWKSLDEGSDPTAD